MNQVLYDYVVVFWQMGILTYLDDTYFFTIYLNYPYFFIHIIPTFFQRRDYYFLS